VTIPLAPQINPRRILPFMRTLQTLTQEAQQVLDETPVGDTLALLSAIRSRDTIKEFAELMTYTPEVQSENSI
jgi:hypothetical protein